MIKRFSKIFLIQSEIFIISQKKNSIFSILKKRFSTKFRGKLKSCGIKFVISGTGDSNISSFSRIKFGLQKYFGTHIIDFYVIFENKDDFDVFVRLSEEWVFSKQVIISDRGLTGTLSSFREKDFFTAAQNTNGKNSIFFRKKNTELAIPFIYHAKTVFMVFEFFGKLLSSSYTGVPAIYSFNSDIQMFLQSFFGVATQEYGMRRREGTRFFDVFVVLKTRREFTSKTIIDNSLMTGIVSNLEIKNLYSRICALGFSQECKLFKNRAGFRGKGALALTAKIARFRGTTDDSGIRFRVYDLSEGVPGIIQTIIKILQNRFGTNLKNYGVVQNSLDFHYFDCFFNLKIKECFKKREFFTDEYLSSYFFKFKIVDFLVATKGTDSAHFLLGVGGDKSAVIITKP